MKGYKNDQKVNIVNIKCCFDPSVVETILASQIQ